MSEEVLSLDLEENDFLYRIRRSSRIVYVWVLDGDIIPHGSRTDSSRVLSKLRDIPMWEKDWRTLIIHKTTNGAKSAADEFMPHSLDITGLGLRDPSYFNILDLTHICRISDRISRVKVGSETRILKIARFKHEVPSLQNEVTVYSELSSCNFPFAPKFYGLAYEETKERIVGILIEDVQGRTPHIRDLGSCRTTVDLLHHSGVIHGDLNRYNFLITHSSAKIFDFEVSTVRKPVDPVEAEEEVRTLEVTLRDRSGIGKH